MCLVCVMAGSVRQPLLQLGDFSRLLNDKALTGSLYVAIHSSYRPFVVMEQAGSSSEPCHQ